MTMTDKTTQKNKINDLVTDLLMKIGSDNGNAIRYRLIYSFCLIIHAFYAILFTCVGVKTLAVFNYFSTAMYFTGLITVRSNKGTVVWLLLMYFEIVVHSVLCSYVMGFNYQFTLYSLAIIPVTYFVTYLDPAFKHSMIVSSVLALVNALTMLFTLYSSIYFIPEHNDFPPEFINLIAQLNLTVAILIIISFSVIFVVKINLDLNTLKKQNDKLDFLANYDQLTGLRNRNHIRSIFEIYSRSTKPYCVILGDIDDFKHVNDTFGHNAGDEVLRTVSAIIKKNVGDRGEVCRWGGEEILIIVRGTTEQCIALNELILDQIRNATVVSGRYRIKITMTFGLCDYSDATNIEKLISLADKRLYIGKKNGKNQIVSKN